MAYFSKAHFKASFPSLFLPCKRTFSRRYLHAYSISIFHLLNLATRQAQYISLLHYTSSMQLFVRARYWTAHITFLWNKHFLEPFVSRPLQFMGFIKIKGLAKLSRSPVSCVRDNENKDRCIYRVRLDNKFPCFYEICRFVSARGAGREVQGGAVAPGGALAPPWDFDI